MKRLGFTLCLATIISLFLVLALTAYYYLESLEFKREAASCRAALSEAQNTINMLEHNVSVLEARTRNYAELIASLREELRVLLENYTRLHTSCEKLSLNYTMLENSYTKLKDEKSRLAKELEEFRARYDELKANYSRLKARLKSLISSYEEIRSRMEALKHNFTMLRGRYERLLAKCKELKENYTRLLRAHKEVMDSIIEASAWHGVYINKSFKAEFWWKLLRSAVSEVGLIDEFSALRGSFAEKALKLMEIIMLKLYYCPDSYVRTVNPLTGGIHVSSEDYMTPLELWGNKCGDCEDLALLAYAALKRTRGVGEKLFIIMVYSGSSGHAALVAVVREGNGNVDYYIVDPAGNYVNGLGILYMLDLGGNRTVLLDPLGLMPQEKEKLANITRVVYYDSVSGEIIKKPRLRVFSNPYVLLEDWVRRYWGFSSVGKVVLIGDNVYKEFTSLSDAAEWLEHVALELG